MNGASLWIKKNVGGRTLHGCAAGYPLPGKGLAES